MAEDTVTVIEELTPEGIEAARMLVELPTDLNPVRLAQLARDIAQDFNAVPLILKKHGLTSAQYEFLYTYNEFFKTLLGDQIKAWQSIKSTEERVKLQSLLAYEELLPTIAGRIGRQTEELRDVIEGAKMLAKVSGIDTSGGSKGTPGEKFHITIDLGSDAKTITVEVPPQPIDVTPTTTLTSPEHNRSKT